MKITLILFAFWCMSSIVILSPNPVEDSQQANQAINQLDDDVRFTTTNQKHKELVVLGGFILLIGGSLYIRNKRK